MGGHYNWARDCGYDGSSLERLPLPTLKRIAGPSEVLSKRAEQRETGGGGVLL